MTDIVDYVNGLKSLSGLRVLTAEQSDFLFDAADEIERLRNVAQGAWQPIETAPKDSTRIDVWFQLTPDHGARWANVMWSPEHKVWTGGPPSQYEGGWVATHWMPFPTAPSNSPEQDLASARLQSQSGINRSLSEGTPGEGASSLTSAQRGDL